jgi:hypothetical protein
MIAVRWRSPSRHASIAPTVPAAPMMAKITSA